MPITVLDPTGQSEAEAPRLAPPLPSLKGALVGLLDNGKANADQLLGEVERLLRAESSAEAGSCDSCGAPHSRGAAFCFQCGAALLETRSVS